MPVKTPGVPKEPKAAKTVRITLGDSHADFQGRANIQKGLRNTAPQSPKFNATIKGTLDTWSKDTDAAVTIYQNVINAEAALEQLYGTLGTTLVQVNLDRDAFITAVANVCVTDADAKSFGASEITRTKLPDPNAPATFRQILTAIPGTNKIRWPSVLGAASYMAEASADPPTATSFANCYTGKSPFFVFVGTPGQKVWFKLCSVGRVPSAWGTAVLVTLR